ncbi:MAG: glycosyltransferase family 4 protein [Candidatus Thiodiazotropha sp. (ex Monitilora ramsayi)]|nr:glycosyltransferase family 4 protein [Candidatus Thiodiazotropha sp. (ex Monitilora ramsayi)]
MRLLIVSQYFWPETFIINDLAGRLTGLGHSVTVLTGKPNYPEGKIYEGYTQQGIQHETLPNNVQIHRVPLRPRHNGGGKNLALNYLSFLASGLLKFPRLVRGQKFDALIFFAPSPMTSALTAVPLKYITGAHFALWIQDLWPESLSATGHIKNRLILFLVKQIIRLIYAFSDTLLIQSQAFYGPVSRIAAENKLVYFPNFSQRNKESQDKLASSIPRPVVELLANNFSVVFTGNLGTAQALETIIDAADQLRDLSDLKIILIGSGSQSEWTHQQVSERHLKNVELPGRFPVALMPELYRHAQGLLVTLKDEEIFNFTVPSKFQAYLAAAKPIIASINGETARILRESGAGYACRAEDAAALADCIRKLYHSSQEERQAMGQRGLEYFEQHFEMETQVDQLVKTLKKRIKNRRI